MRLFRRYASVGLVAALFVLASAVGVSGSTGAAVQKPDLVSVLPTQPSSAEVAPVYVDRYAMSHHLLYRFDAVVWNQGGTLDLFRAADGSFIQALWPDGKPTTKPDPNVDPVDPAMIREDRSALRPELVYVAHAGHVHWHLLNVAKYELLVPGETSRESKPGFCLVDNYGTPQFFRPGFRGKGPGTWCRPSEPTAPFVRMGISPGAGFRYASQVPGQWIDVTDLAPGPYVFQATVNPLGLIDEADPTNNVVQQLRMIPGTTATNVAARTEMGRPVTVRLEGRVVAPEVLARVPHCRATATDPACYIAALSSGPLEFRIDRHPSHGRVSIVFAGGLLARAKYVPNGRYTGRDAFTYHVTDARGLSSASASVRVRVASVCVVPRLRGRTLRAATRSIKRAGCTRGRVRRVYSNAVSRGRVVAQSPRAGKRLHARTKVTLTISRGKRRL